MDFHIYHHFHFSGDGGVERDIQRKLGQILVQLGAIQRTETQIMVDITSLKAQLAEIDSETNDIATKLDVQTAVIADLTAKLAAGGVVTQADLDGLSDTITPISARLKLLGQVAA